MKTGATAVAACIEDLQQEQHPIYLMDTGSGPPAENPNTHVLWGWKRDVGEQKRMVYFSGDIARTGAELCLIRYFFCYWTLVREDSAARLIEDINRCRRSLGVYGSNDSLSVRKKRGLVQIEYRFGSPTALNLDHVSRLRLRRPRTQILPPDFPPQAPLAPNPDLFPADVYVGSGMSYEAGLPTLCDMHELFGVDDVRAGSFTVGESDSLPAVLAEDGADRIKEFCCVHVKAMFAPPTSSMLAIERLYAKGMIGRIFTDNVDNMLAKISVEFERVRGSGVFNERYEASFAQPVLIVVGVAADRRQIIAQARKKGVRIVVVNPCYKVSPNVTHLDYLRREDQFYKTEAESFFRDVAPAA